jgi:hypothetical protein
MKLPVIFVATLLMTSMGHASSTVYSIGPIEGKLKRVYSDTITLDVPAQGRSNDSINGGTGEFAVNVDGQTTYQNFVRLSDLREGDQIQVQYNEDNRKKIATSIMKVASAGTDTVSAGAETQVTTVTTTTTTTVPSPSP